MALVTVQRFDVNLKLYQMEDDYPHFTDQFCWNIMEAVESEYLDNIEILQNNLLIRDDKEQLAYIETKRTELLNSFNQYANYCTHIPVATMNTVLDFYLVQFFVTNDFFMAEDIEFKHSIKPGQYKYDAARNVLIVHGTGVFNKEKPNFDFSTLECFYPLLEYITYGKLILELNNLKKEITEKIKTDDQRSLNPANDKTDIMEKQEIHLDFSDNSKAERIVFLHELGILDYLQKKMNVELNSFCSNKLAEIVSTFSDVPYTTAQSYLNPMYSRSADQSKNPMTAKSLEKVKNKLKDIGFSTTKNG